MLSLMNNDVLLCSSMTYREESLVHYVFQLLF